nr:hypothetical protein [Pseudomonas syringae]
MVEVPVANRAYRIRALGRMLEEAEERRYIAQVLKLLEQAAKEYGDMYTVRRISSTGSYGQAAARIIVDFLLAPDCHLSRNTPL